LFYPFFFAKKNALVSEILVRDIRIAFCYIAFIVLTAAALIGWLRRRWSSRRTLADNAKSEILWFLAILFAVSYIVWQVQFSIYRYLIMLELLAPVFLALILNRFLRREAGVFSLSLVLNAVICLFVIPADFGRQPFDDDFLKTDIPSIEELDKSVVLMGGMEATSYIIPYMPSGTRFVRVTSNFISPGRNMNLDCKIRGILAQYDNEHTFVYFAGKTEKESVCRDVGYYGVRIDERYCHHVRSRDAYDGYLCSAVCGRRPQEELSSFGSIEEPIFEKKDGVRLSVAVEEHARRNRILFRLCGLKLQSIDLMYTLDNTPMPPENGWKLDKTQSVSFPISSATRRGLYHFIGIRDSRGRDKNVWIQVDASVTIQ
jgi:hypothetical protein